jgi:hypothetical protein
MLHSNRTIIPGPPGTGKTYRLVNHHLASELKTVAPDKIYMYPLVTLHLMKQEKELMIYIQIKKLLLVHYIHWELEN